MLEVMIERWIGAGGSTDFRWSLWRDGHRVAMGRDVHVTTQECEGEAAAYCQVTFGSPPDQVTLL